MDPEGIRRTAMPREGEPAPPLRLPADDGSVVDLADFRGRAVALFFVPRAATPG
jgi:peroxiredoxin Q/BCP